MTNIVEYKYSNGSNTARIVDPSFFSRRGNHTLNKILFKIRTTSVDALYKNIRFRVGGVASPLPDAPDGSPRFTVSRGNAVTLHTGYPSLTDFIREVNDIISDTIAMEKDMVPQITKINGSYFMHQEVETVDNPFHPLDFSEDDMRRTAEIIGFTDEKEDENGNLWIVINDTRIYPTPKMNSMLKLSTSTNESIMLEGGIDSDEMVSYDTGSTYKMVVPENIQITNTMKFRGLDVADIVRFPQEESVYLEFTRMEEL